MAQELRAVGAVLTGLSLGLCALGSAAVCHPRGRVAAAPADLNGVWTNASYTQFERPKALKSLVVTPEEAQVYEAALRKSHGILVDPHDKLGQEESEFGESGEGLARIRGQIRSSWIVSPTDGQVPYSAQAKARWKIGPHGVEDGYDNPEERPQSERCIAANGSGPPQMSEQDANLFTIVQTKDHVAIAAEKNHDVRIIPLHAVRNPLEPRTWSGTSIGRWDGKTLVVETDRFREGLIDRDFFLYSGDAKVVERLTRTGPGEILYEFTVVDPALFTQPLQAEMLITAAKGRMFEYACHEGNYSMPSILQAARLGRQRSSTPAVLPAGSPAAP